MPGAIIKIDQDRSPDPVSYGTPGVARKDLWLNKEITFNSTVGGNSSTSWTLLSKPVGSAAVLMIPEVGSYCKLTPDIKGSYRIQLVTNNGGVGNVQILIAAVTFDEFGEELDLGVRIPAFGETTGTENNWDGNVDGWAESIAYFMSTTIEQFALGGTSSKPFPVEVVSETNVDVSVGGLLTIDGYTVQEDNPVLLAGQTDATEVGIWVASSGAWIRHPYFATGARFIDGTFVSIRRGTYAKVVWSIFWVDPDGGHVLGTDELMAQNGAGTPGPAGPPGANGSSSNLWAYAAETTVGGDPSDGHIRWNNATQISSTALHIDLTTANAEDVTFLLKILGTSEKIAIYGGDSADYQIWQVTGSTTHHVGQYVEVPVVLVSSGGSGTTGFVAETNLTVSTLWGGVAAASGAGNVFIYDSGAVPSGPVYSNFTTLMTDRAAIPGPAIIIFHDTGNFPAGSFDLTDTTIHVPETVVLTITAAATLNTPAAISGGGTLVANGGQILVNGGATITVTDTTLTQTHGSTPMFSADDDLVMYLRGNATILVGASNTIVLDTGKNLTLYLYDHCKFSPNAICDGVFTVYWKSPDAVFSAPNGCSTPTHQERYTTLPHRSFVTFHSGNADTHLNYRTEADLFSDINLATGENGHFPLDVHVMTDMTLPGIDIYLYRKIRFLGRQISDRPTINIPVGTTILDPCEFHQLQFASVSNSGVFGKDYYSQMDVTFVNCRFSTTTAPLFITGNSSDIIRMKNACNVVDGGYEVFELDGANAVLVISEGTDIASETIRGNFACTIVGDSTSSVSVTQSNLSVTPVFYGGGLVQTANSVLAGITRGQPGTWTATPAVSGISLGGNPATSGTAQICATEATSLIAYKNVATNYVVAEIDASGYLVLGNISRGGVTLKAKTGEKISFYNDAGEKVKVDSTGLVLVGNDGSAIYGGDSDGMGAVFSLLSATDTATYLGAFTGSISAKIADSTAFAVTNNTSYVNIVIATAAVSIMSDSAASSVTYSSYDKTANSATGHLVHLKGQDCTGTTSIGGETRVSSGNGTSRAGYLTFYRGTTQRGQIGTGSTGHGGIWFGRSNTINANDSFAVGVSNTITNDYSTAIGVTNSVSGSVAIAIGGSNIASADYTCTIGYSNVASVFGAVAVGNQNTSSGNSAFSAGILCTAANVSAIALGYYAYASSYAEFAHASGNAPGIPQNSVVQVSGVTTATASTNVDLKAGPTADQEIITRSNRIYLVRVEFVATSASFTLVGAITLRDALVKNTSGTVTVIDAGTQDATASTPADWVISLAGSGTNLRVNFLKTADATALRCSAKVTLVEVAKA
mgnify:CR=1 FL=1